VWEGKEVAIKVGYPVRVTEDLDPLQEAKITESLHHHNIVQTLKYTHRTVSKDNDSKHDEVVHVEPWYVMQYCDKGTLQVAIQANVFGHSHKYKLSWALQCLKDISQALMYLHGMGVMHGDLTCSNVMLMSDSHDSRGFHLKIADFGQAQVFSKWPGPQKNVDTYGTVTHQPPELLMNGVLTPQADVWAFGMIMWELFTGIPPYADYRPAQMIYIITVAKHLPPIPTHCPKDYHDLMLNCWKRQPQRPDFAKVHTAVTDMLRKLSAGKT
jgi:serine/threonine protein kinase